MKRKDGSIPQEKIFVSRMDVAALLNLSPSTIRRLELGDSNFPRRRQISPRRVGWPIEEVLEWAEARQNVR